jgi:hypothetical protein
MTESLQNLIRGEVAGEIRLPFARDVDVGLIAAGPGPRSASFLPD